MTMFCGLLLSTWLLIPFPVAAHETFIAPQHLPFLYHVAAGSISYRREEGLAQTLRSWTLL